MTETLFRVAGTMGRTLFALLAGIASGALLVAAYLYISNSEPLVFEGLFEIALLYGAAIAVICVPVWLALARMHWDRAPAAAALGFAATALFLGFTYTAGSHDRPDLMAYSFLPYSLCGAVAALVTWGVGKLLQQA